MENKILKFFILSFYGILFLIAKLKFGLIVHNVHSWAPIEINQNYIPTKIVYFPTFTNSFKKSQQILRL